jgi:hypothetical protein
VSVKTEVERNRARATKRAHVVMCEVRFGGNAACERDGWPAKHRCYRNRAAGGTTCADRRHACVCGARWEPAA